MQPPGPTERRGPVATGEVVAGKYVIERIVGSGGMGIVAVARHMHLDERVAIKLMLPEYAASAQGAAARFVREGRAAAKIRSEHVARVIDVGTLESGEPYLVMEFLEGRDLHQLLSDTGPLPVDNAVDYILQACEALAEAHALGIVHRDLKPANLFLTARADGSACVKVLDFGISKMASADSAAMTNTRAVMGSPVYMSPEQLESTRDVDARGDVWALGVSLYELLAGHLPFEAESMAQLVTKVLSRQPEPLRLARPDVPEALERVINKCLEKDPAARFQNVGTLALALAPLAPERSRVSIERAARVAGSSPKLVPAAPISVRDFDQTPRASSPSSIAVTSLEATSSVGRHGPESPRRLLWVLGGLVSIAFVAGGVTVFRKPWVSPPPAQISAPPAPEAKPPASAATAAALDSERAPAPQVVMSAAADAGVRRIKPAAAGSTARPSTPSAAAPPSTPSGTRAAAIPDDRL